MTISNKEKSSPDGQKKKKINLNETQKRMIG